MSFWIVTDACCDLPVDYIREHRDFLVAPMSYQIDGSLQELDLTRDDNAAKTHAFYESLLNGSVSTTFQVNQQNWTELAEPLLKEGNDVLLLAFSSGLSGTCAAAMSAAADLSAKYPDRKIYAFDTLSASMGEGLAVHYALQKREEGLSIDETLAWLQQNVQRMIHWFTVTDLHFLHRGGRVSATSAYFGSILKIKPILNVDPKGKLIAREKVQGRKHSLRALLEKVQQDAFQPETQTMFISHGDCEKEALWLADKLTEELHVPKIVMSMIGPIVGTHSGPGTVAVFFTDKDGAARLNAPENE